MKEKATFMIFFAIVFTVNLVVNIYIFSRTRSVFPLGNAAWWGATIIFWLLAFAYVIGRFTERAGPIWLAEPFVKIGSWWLGAMLYLTLIFLLADILRGLNGLFNISELFRFSWMTSKGKTAVLLVYSLTAVILAFGYFNAKFPTVRKEAFQISKNVPEGYQKVVLVSDIHLGMMISNGRLNRLIKLVNKENADIVLLAGDIFDEDLGPVIQKIWATCLKTYRPNKVFMQYLETTNFTEMLPLPTNILKITKLLFFATALLFFRMELQLLAARILPVKG
jgi:uncharacterized protein